jgi:hypothetical protein
MAIPIDPHYIPAFSIEDVLLDKDTGAPLTGGLVYFYEDDQRGVLKPVYQITGTSPNYTFAELPNPITLSAIGTFEDALDNPVIPYFYPYDAAGNVELYYIVVTSSTDVPQFTRQAQPFIEGAGSSSEVSEVISNELSNPQFAQVLFDTTAPFVLSFNAVSDEVVSIAPDWDLIVTSPAVGTVTLNQIAPTGSLNVVSNPATILNITSSGITSLKLRQRIYGSPNLWGSGYISATFVAKTYSGTAPNLNLFYSQSDGTVVDQLLLSASLLASGSYAAYSGSALIPVSTNPDTFPDAYIDIYFDLPLSIEIDITSVMVAKTGTVSIDDIFYDQESYERQIDHLFHYYKPQLEYKPIPSYLVGWDFIMNPGQLAGKTIAAKATGANTGWYAWDQTIVFQTVNSSINVAPAANSGAFAMGFDLTGQGAIIQYLGRPQAIEILLNRICSMINCAGSVATKITITLWYTTNTTLPKLETQTIPVTYPGAMFFTGLDANGVPSGVIANWFKVPRENQLGDAHFTTTVGYQDHTFSGWNLDDETIAGTARFFAIVVGTASVPTPQTVAFKYISLNAGDIPTKPAPQTEDEVLRECQYYYEPSGFYAEEMLINPSPYLTAAGTTMTLIPRIFTVDYQTKRTSSPYVLLYSPISGTPAMVNGVIFNGASVQINADIGIGNWSQQDLTSKSVVYEPANTTPRCSFLVGAAANFPEAFITYQAITDARLGVVD